jgi:hypothetical protein
MFRLIALSSFALAVAISAYAMTPVPLAQPDSILTQVRMGCGVGRVMVNGVCEARTTIRHERRQARRCARWTGSTCAQWQ